MRSPWLPSAIGAVPVLALTVASEVTRCLKRLRSRRRRITGKGIDVPSESDFPSQYGQYREGVW